MSDSTPHYEQAKRSEPRKAECVFATSTGLLRPSEEVTLPPVTQKPKRTNGEMNATFNRLHYTKKKGEESLENSTRSPARKGYQEPTPPRTVINPERVDGLVSRLAQIPKRMIYAASTPHQPTSSSTVILGAIDDQKPPSYNAKKDTHLAMFWARQQVLQQNRAKSSSKKKRKDNTTPRKEQDSNYEKAPMPTSDADDGNSDKKKQQKDEKKEKKTAEKEEPRRAADEEEATSSEEKPAASDSKQEEEESRPKDEKDTAAEETPKEEEEQGAQPKPEEQKEESSSSSSPSDEIDTSYHYFISSASTVDDEGSSSSGAKVVGCVDGGDAAGTLIGLVEKTDAASQKWVVTKTGSSSYVLSPEHTSSQNFDSPGLDQQCRLAPKNNEGEPISEDQQLTITAIGGNYFTIKCGDQVMEVNPSTQKVVAAESYSGANNQKFFFTKVA